MRWFHITVPGLGVCASLFDSVIGAFVDRGVPTMWTWFKCGRCETVWHSWNLRPFVNLLARRVSCFSCYTKILTELIAIGVAVIFVAAVAYAILPFNQFVMGTGFGWTLLALAWIDSRIGRLPDLLTLPLCAAGLFIAAQNGVVALNYLLGAATGFAGSALIAYGYRRCSGREGLGGGDVKLFGAIGAWLGWQALPFAIFFSCLGALAFLIVRQRGALIDTVPFGPFIATAAWAVWAWQIAVKAPI